MNDDELAQQQVDAEIAERRRTNRRVTAAEEPAPSIREWSIQADLLAGIHDRLGSLISATYATTPGVKKVPRLKPLPRPETAYERRMRRARDREREMLHNWIVSQVLPNK